jgi:hypothetical protein
MRSHWMRRGVKIVLIAAVAIGVFSLIVMLLWNALMPTLFARPAITFWQAAGVLILSRILVGGLRGRGGTGPWPWRRRLMERWARMTPEERERFRQGLETRWGPFAPPPEPKP